MPTERELAILRVIWEQGPTTVRQVNQTLNQTVPTGLTTTLKLMQIMTEKGLLIRDESVRPQIFRPGEAQEKTLRGLAGDLLERAYGGSPRAMVLQALEAADVDAADLARVEKLLNKIERGK